MVTTKFKFLSLQKRYYSTNIKNKYALDNKGNHPYTVESYYNTKTNTVDLIAVNVTHSPQTFYEGKGYINQSVGYDQKGREIYLFTGGLTTKSYTKANKFLYDMKKNTSYSISSDETKLHELTSTYIELETAQQENVELQFPLKKETMQEFQDKTLEFFENIKKD